MLEVEENISASFMQLLIEVKDMLFISHVAYQDDSGKAAQHEREGHRGFATITTGDF